MRLCPLRNCRLAIWLVRRTTSSLAYWGSSTICCSVFLQHVWQTPWWVLWGHVCLPLSQDTLLSQLHGKYLLNTVWFSGCPHSSSFSVPPTLATSLETAHSSWGAALVPHFCEGFSLHAPMVTVSRTWTLSSHRICLYLWQRSLSVLFIVSWFIFQKCKLSELQFYSWALHQSRQIIK